MALNTRLLSHTNTHLLLTVHIVVPVPRIKISKVLNIEHSLLGDISLNLNVFFLILYLVQIDFLILVLRWHLAS